MGPEGMLGTLTFMVKFKELQIDLCQRNPNSFAAHLKSINILIMI